MLNDLKEMEKVLNMPAIKLKQPTETRWLSHEQAVHSLRKCLCAIKANEGDATALHWVYQHILVNLIS